MVQRVLHDGLIVHIYLRKLKLKKARLQRGKLQKLARRDVSSPAYSSLQHPFWGYGKHCLPKKTKQLLINYSDKTNNLIETIMASNKIRKILLMVR